jgi:hypothetical protein
MLAGMDSLDPVALPLGSKRRQNPAGRAAAPEKVLVCQPLPPWAALAGRSAEAVPAFAAGAVFLALDRIVRAEPDWAGVWRQRQALRAAAACARLLRHREDEAALRDAHCLTRSGDDPGPAGRIYRLWRQFADRPTRLAEPSLLALAAALGVAGAAKAFEGLGLRSDNPDPLKAALEAADAVVLELEAGAGEAAVLAGMSADFVLARRLGWPRPLPLFGAGGAGRRTPVAELYSKIVGEAVACHAQAGDLERRAARLQAAGAVLRVKGAGRGVLALLADDVVGAADLCRLGGAQLGSERAARRFLDRLVELGALRELSRRPTFRLFGL